MDVSIIGRTTLKPLVHFFDHFFILMFLNLYSHTPKLPRFLTKGIRASKLKIFGRAKNCEAHKMKIKGVSIQGGVNYSGIKM